MTSRLTLNGWESKDARRNHMAGTLQRRLKKSEYKDCNAREGDDIEQQDYDD